MNAREFLAAICVKCPSYQVPLPGCSLAPYRKPEDSHEEAFAKLTDDQVEDLVRAHFLCVCHKDGCGS
ncbi:MAG: hypothetical protein WCS65_10635 [Verrucomicrobiae bacterium]